MSKKGSDGFQNRAAMKFKQPDKIDLMTQQDIFKIFDDEIDTILDQVTANREHRGKYPTYVANAFANLSTALWFKEYVNDHCKITKKGKFKTDLTDDQVESLRTLLAEAYKKSATNQYAQQTQEYDERNKMLSKTFIILYWKVYRLARKLKVEETYTRDLTIQVYGDPTNNMKFIHKIFKRSVLSDKKKIKLMKEMYKAYPKDNPGRFQMAVGAAMTVDSNSSDMIAALYTYMMKLKKKKRAPIIMAYAMAYKKNKSNNFRLTGGEFYKKNKPMIKELKEIDIGFKKAFKPLKAKKVKKEVNDIIAKEKKEKKNNK